MKHLDLLASSSTAGEILSVARAHSTVHPSDPYLAKRLIAFEVLYEPDIPARRSNCQKALTAITKAPQPSAADQNAIAECYISWIEAEQLHLDEPTFDKIVKKYLRDSLRWSHLPELHSQLLSWHLDRLVQRGSFLEFFRHAVKTYRPSADFYGRALQGVAEQEPVDAASLKEVYEAWRAWCRSPATKVEAAEAYMEVLMRLGRGREAHDEYERVKREVGRDAGALQRVEDTWRTLLESREKQDEASGSDDDGDSDVSQGEEEEDEDVSMDDE